jgi:Tat protein secretion system quality control protein TatD with DNase activity
LNAHYFTADLHHVLERAKRAGVAAQIVTAGDLGEIDEALSIAKQHGE